MPRGRLIEIEPDLAFGIFVPPLLFSGAISTSLRGLRANARAILRLAVGLVIATALVVAVVARTFVHALDWHGAFVLGAIVAPPDAIVAIALARALRMSRRTVNVLEGETLLNDTTGFVIYRLAVRAATTGAFDARTAVPLFLLIATGGAVVGWVVYRVVRFMSERLADPVLETVLLLVTPFAAYLPAEALGASGVLAVVVAGVLLRRSSALLVPARARFQGSAVYSVVEFVLNSLVFILIGMQLGQILRDPHASSIAEVLRATLVTGATVVAVRIVWVFASAYIPRLSRRFHERGRLASFGNVAIVAWTGIRGGDSLVTALAVPHVTALGMPLPGRELIVATTFGVILLTLLVQGLSLAPLVRALDQAPDRSRAAEEALARQHMIAAGEALLERRQRDGDVPEAVIERVRRKYREQGELEIALKVDDEGRRLGATERTLERELLGARRRAAVHLQRDQVIDDAVLRELERELDLEEVRLEDTMLLGQGESRICFSADSRHDTMSSVAASEPSGGRSQVPPRGVTTMTTAEIGRKYVALSREGKRTEILESLFGEAVVSVEAIAPPGGDRTTKGLDAVRGKSKWWSENNILHGAEVFGPYPHDDRFAVRFLLDVTNKQSGERRTVDEIGLFTVVNGKITREEFFYPVG